MANITSSEAWDHDMILDFSLPYHSVNKLQKINILIFFQIGLPTPNIMP